MKRTTDSGGDVPQSFTPTNQLPRRRNGKEQACEPCRKAKIKCDHGLPTCLNCKRRTKSCIYLPAPMSQLKRSRGSEPPGGSITTPASPRPLLSPEPAGLEVATTQSPLPALRLPKSGTATKTGAPDHLSGFLSSTSFPAIVETLGPLPSAVETTDMAKHLTSEQVEGIKLLRQLPDRRTCDALIRHSADSDQLSFHQPTIVGIASSLWSTFGHYLEEPRHLHGLELVVQEVIHNSSKPLEEPDDYHEWLSVFSGPNLRWEALGMIFISMAFSCLSVTADTIQIQQGTTILTKNFSIKLKGCAETIIGILRKNETINVLVVALLGKNLHLGTLIHGDTSFSIWREHGDLVGAMTALNLHRDDGTNNSSAPEAVTISQQIRRRLFNSVFIMDKSLALFNGRPPILSQRYCSCPLPLDLPDDAYTQGKENLLREVNQLDANGWSRKYDGKFHDMTGAIVGGLFYKIFEEILEILMGNPEQFSEERLNNLKVRSSHTFASLPPHLHFLRADTHPVSDSDVPSRDADRIHWSALCYRLEYLRMSFLIERLSTERSSLPQNQSRQKLLDISRDMLDKTIYLWLQRDRFKYRLHDYDYMLMCFGMPSAGILCVELLRSIKQDNKEGDKERDRLIFPRSEVVQNLSLLVGFLDWVRFGAANYILVRRMRQIIQRILDMVLDPNPREQPEKRRKSEQQSSYLQPNLSVELQQKPLARAENEIQGQGVAQHGEYPEAGYNTAMAFSGAPTFPSQSQIQTTAQPRFGYGAAGSMGFGMGVGNSGGNGMTGDEFLLDASLENLDWLDTVDWTRGPWIDLN